MTINVTAKDIKIGLRRTCSFCPIALAIRRAISRTSIYVWNGQVRVYKGGELLSLLSLPLEAQEFILNFDAELPVYPFDFELKIPEII